MDPDDINQIEAGKDHTGVRHEDLLDAEYHEDSDDDEDLTPAQLIQELENAWLNEKFAPELLPNKQSVVELTLLQISHMEDNLKRLDKGDVRMNIHTMELSRIRFMISSYLRKRLEKIEEFAIHLLSEDAKRSPEQAFMTPAETKFAREYVSSVECLFSAIALQHMPPRIKDFELNKLSSKPNLDKHVFIRANTDRSGILIPSIDLEVDITKGSQHIIQYSAIAHLVKSGEVQLI
ncbi:hypothetical protein QAD02_020012 [Eretmocerus hayati]|uniref:Uncharacterized protein n=1 Tax=Eretmocerus hayati TaxID=131215 RepID=A0ACC2PKU0_9HYME|nr:hypothetical protein QAD02_020012 [Eretmocerus hayati]